MRSRVVFPRTYPKAVSVFLFATWLTCAWGAANAEDKDTAKKEPDGNAHCCVCHGDLRTEKIAVAHLAEDITCEDCHGESVLHMHDEMLMTKPDRLYGRDEVVPTCRKCHARHMDEKRVEEFRAKWLGRRRPNGRTIAKESICTDCHGTHNIVREQVKASGEEASGAWTPMFDGEGLSGWRTKGGASWSARNGRLAAAPGPNGEEGDLWSEAEYGDFRVSVTFRASWPVRAGIWLRATDEKPGVRVEVLEQAEPLGFTGSLLVPRRGLALVNLRGELFDPEGWNTISAEARGERVRVWLNGEEIGAVRTDAPAKGRIGLHLGRQTGNKAGELSVREVLVQLLDDPEKETGASAQSGVEATGS